MNSNDNAKKRFSDLARENGFAVIRNGCCRLTAGGILQLLKVEYDPRFRDHTLYMGLYSLYSELDLHWLKPAGWILHYPVVGLVGIRDSDDIPIATQLSILSEVGIPWLDRICSQQNLINAMCDIEMRQYGKIRWLDNFKLAPFLSVGDFSSAMKVIESILQQHTGPRRWTSEPWERADYETYKELFPGKDQELLGIYEWITTRNTDAIKDYLENNLNVNLSNLKLQLPSICVKQFMQ